MNIISQYTSEQAVDDGVLFDVTTLNPEWKKGIFNYVTTNLLSHGYMKDRKIFIPNLLDLLNQYNMLVSRKTNGFKDFDTFFSGLIELPTGTKHQVFICQNETEKFTIMLPEDY